ncbi:MAG: hypothetical protein ACT4NP_01865 [Pseudonocardiales bacterium]
MTTPDNQPVAQPTTLHSPTRTHRQHNPATPADPPHAHATPHQPSQPPVHAEICSHPHCPAPRAPTDDACPPPPGTIPPGVDPDDWERNLHRVLDGMPRTINPASARILADLLADDRTPADKPTPRGLG